VFPPHIRKRLAVEAGVTFGWYKYVGIEGQVLGIDRFGASGDGNAVLAHFGFSAEEVYKRAKELLNK